MATTEGNKKILTVLGEDIEEAVASKHSHTNAEALNKISEDENGEILYNNEQITMYKISTTEPATKSIGSIWIVK